MPKPLDPTIVDILKTCGLKSSDALWDCHGTWVMYHWAVEEAAAKAKIKFAPPLIVESSSEKKTVVVLVEAVLGDKTEWSFGEASPANNKNAYPYAMAEKRAKDRVAIKLLGLYGIYSEEEADAFKEKPDDRPKSAPGVSAAKVAIAEAVREINACEDGDTLLAYLNTKDMKKLVVQVCRTWPELWTGPEEDAGLRGMIFKAGKANKCEGDIQTYLVAAENAARNQQKAD
jgi:hypothetical protein